MREEEAPHSPPGKITVSPFDSELKASWRAAVSSVTPSPVAVGKIIAASAKGERRRRRKRG